MRQRPFKICLALICAWGMSASSASAGISFVNMFRSDTYIQVANSNQILSTGSFLSLGLFSTNPNDYTSVMATFPGPVGSGSFTQTSPTVFAYQSAVLGSHAAMDTAYPIGGYVFNATNGTTSNSTSLNYAADAYSATLPFLVGTDYSDLQGVNAANPITLHFSAMSPAASANEGLVFFTISDVASNNVLFDAGFLPSTTTSVAVPANTLAPGTQYRYELIFSDRVFVATTGTDFNSQLGFDDRTSGLFTTAVDAPEPACLGAAGILAVTILRRKR